MKKIFFTCIFLSLFSCGKADDAETTDGIGEGDHRVFVSSSVYTGNLGGLTGADEKCNALAEAAGLEHTYKAILSDTSSSAKDRLVFTGEVYVINDEGEADLVVSQGSDLWGTDDDNLLSRINYNESKELVSSNPWTGTTSNGGEAVDTCSDWASDSGDGALGSTDQYDTRWLEDDSNLTDSCGNGHQIFCISQSDS